MFGRSMTLFRPFGFAVRVDASWIFIALLVTWSLASGVFPEHLPGYSPRTYWLMGIVGALGLFGSVVLHELSHSLPGIPRLALADSVGQDCPKQL